MSVKDPIVNWLLESDDPSIRYLTLTDILDIPSDAKEVLAAKKQIPNGPIVKTLLSGQQADGGFGVHPYQKWTGAHWRLVSLVELGIPPGFRPAVKATNLVLKWLLGEAHLRNVPKINGLYRRCASQEGNALAVCSRLGLAEDPRVVKLAESLAEWQWPDGGWNCDRSEDAHHSSFNESLSTLWGLVEYYRATGDKDALKTAGNAAEFFLKHRLFRSCRTGLERQPETFHSKTFRVVHLFTQLHYPLYWHCDILQELTILSRAGKLDDPRTKEALDIVEKKRGPDGLWQADDYYWSMRGTPSTKTKMNVSNVEIVDWGRKGPNRMITLNAIRALKAARREP
ncbi:hypothetical protein E6H34_05605 [Candidatus Bathyarchaeota archaeon]|nr:MAG: hypothetical protein E6H34_05605 [Candidatus Bathyarchaeota archaeon]